MLKISMNSYFYYSEFKKNKFIFFIVIVFSIITGLFVGLEINKKKYFNQFSLVLPPVNSSISISSKYFDLIKANKEIEETFVSNVYKKLSNIFIEKHVSNSLLFKLEADEKNARILNEFKADADNILKKIINDQIFIIDQIISNEVEYMNQLQDKFLDHENKLKSDSPILTSEYRVFFQTTKEIKEKINVLKLAKLKYQTPDLLFRIEFTDEILTEQKNINIYILTIIFIIIGITIFFITVTIVNEIKNYDREFIKKTK